MRSAGTKRKINAIEGLTKIQNAIEDQRKWWSELDRAMNSEDGCVRMKEKPEDNITKLKQNIRVLPPILQRLRSL